MKSKKVNFLPPFDLIFFTRLPRFVFTRKVKTQKGKREERERESHTHKIKKMRMSKRKREREREIKRSTIRLNSFCSRSNVKLGNAAKRDFIFIPFSASAHFRNERFDLTLKLGLQCAAIVKIKVTNHRAKNVVNLRH